MTDIAIIGAGIAGLVCAQQLTQAGYSVVVVEKSRGLGGRVATRRLHDTRADHGACYLKPKGELLQGFVKLLSQHNIVEVWTDTYYELPANSHLPIKKSGSPCYTAPTGMSAIAKFLAQDLDILLNQRVTKIDLTPENIWRLSCVSSNTSPSNNDSENKEITAKALVVAIPAPQATTLLESLGNGVINSAFLDQLRSVDFHPCISVMAGYSSVFDTKIPEWKALNFSENNALAWIGFDSSKRHQSHQPVFVVQSSSEFAQIHLETEELQSVGEKMLQSASESLMLETLKTPEWMQVHRWRYAFPRHPLSEKCLSAQTILPLVCCGDWCGGNLIGGAMDSGLAAAKDINAQLEQKVLLDSFLENPKFS
ncbi:NAD(P)/FAD-dependent oxidoreductase [Mastigocoleus testarum]|uniref:FAD-dependent oxidoreductase n=1 Tax=Mastigocoleus testarum BC008 TaxID=371196 RepID=A0A0V7ZH43_9CYAN|nr:FAD-dependent oxidoreductase [Mastigocoleus testarum]KST63819.1 FAD-dependent oxidoreductase [Mastigocoleus testarum BC008]